jgi:alpha-1,3/alpha-1,6-mannosyltransferase
LLLRLNIKECIVYPGIVLRKLLEYDREEALLDALQERKLIVSLNRFERKKNISLALKAFALLLQKNLDENGTLLLVIAGGYDPRLEENVSHLQELRLLCHALQLKNHILFSTKDISNLSLDFNVLFLPSIPEKFKVALIHQARIIVYTPWAEHFGIVPLESMASGSSITVAMDSGGPKETIKHAETGFLAQDDPLALATLLQDILIGEKFNITEILDNAKRHVTRNFSINTFVELLLE